jgi:RHS repeat-associated protein
MTNISSVANANRLRLEFAYDSQHRRVSKIVKSWTGSAFANPVTNLFVYDGWNLLATLTFDLSPLTSFLWGQDLSGTFNAAGGVGGLLLATFYGSLATNAFTAYEGNGNVVALINAVDASTCARYEYSPYGGTVRATGLLALQNPFRFSTKFLDAESGLVYYGWRYYNPVLGRWVGREPTIDQILQQLYLFCVNNPVCRFDIDGRTDWLLVKVGLLKILGGACTAFASGCGEVATGGAATAFAAWGVMTGGVMFATGMSQLMEGIFTPDSQNSSPRQQEMLDLPDSVGGVIGKAIGGDLGAKVGDFVESSVFLMNSARNLPVVGRGLARALGDEFGKQMLEFADDLIEGGVSAYDGLKKEDQEASEQ